MEGDFGGDEDEAELEMLPVEDPLSKDDLQPAVQSPKGDLLPAVQPPKNDLLPAAPAVEPPQPPPAVMDEKAAEAALQQFESQLSSADKDLINVKNGLEI